MAEQQEASQIQRIQTRIPPFWPDDPELWFAQIENQFQLSGITADGTKYGYVAGSLEARFASEVRDILTAPPSENKYGTLKNELIRRLSITQEQKTRQLLELEELGDRKPSQFLRHLQQLAGTAVPETLLRSIWSNRLPTNVRAILATQADVNLTKVAELADAIVSTTTNQPLGPTVNTLDDTIKNLVDKVAQLQTELRGRPTNREKGKSRTRSSSRNKTYDKCWYHYKFGNKAKRCKPPCTAARNQGNEQSSR
ncbi:hypothetical protein RI129_001808 [Pyrocoelia pectoralis]|uniref:DUF7041 domain-containing protein n=1 Tax=Pyrocoelia pectoralis TaxID=417401 RepID=A0AAN7W0F6_9COLE